MHPRTRQQLLALSADFYQAHAAGFDASRGHQPWPGWARLLDFLPGAGTELSVLDVGCGNARLAPFLAESGFALRYVGVDANAPLLEAAHARLSPDRSGHVELIEQDFLGGSSPGEDLPTGPFDFVALFGVLHHVPGRDWRGALLRALAQRVAPGGVLALAAWQFSGRDRFERRRVDWADLDPVLGETIDVETLEVGDGLLRFGSNPALPPRYCHQVADTEFESFPSDLARAGAPMEVLADFRADGSEGDLNRYLVLRRPS